MMNKAADTALLIDHTLLKPDAATAEIKKLCREARDHGFYSVCVNQSNIALCREQLKGAQVKVCSVIGFPLGATGARVKAYETGEAVRAGAGEIDMVINLGALKSGEYPVVLQDIRAVRKACRGKVLKVIIEAGLLTDKEKVKACSLAKKGGADFVKTSTGFFGGADARDVRLMRKTVGPSIGVKAAGGIKTVEKLFEMTEAGASRIGTSSGIAIISQIRISDRASNSRIKKYKYK